MNLLLAPPAAQGTKPAQAAGASTPQQTEESVTPPDNPTESCDG